MEQKEFSFDEATPLQEFIDTYRDRIIGHTLKACYVNDFVYINSRGASGSAFFVLDNAVIGIEYLYPGHATIITADVCDFEITGEIESDTRYKTLEFHSRIPGRDDEGLLWCTEMPGMNQRIVDITIGRHSEQYEDYPNSLRLAGGDYFSWILLTLEDGTELHINASPAEMDGYVEVWLSNLPAYSLIKSELDRPPSEWYYRVDREFNQVIWGCEPQPDELAELAMYYMRKCDHEVENHREDPDFCLRDSYTNYLKHIIQLFTEREMNKDYVDSTGKSLLDLALEIGEEAGSRALPSIYWTIMLSSSLSRICRSLKSDYNILMMHRKEEKELYDSLPEKVKNTSFGKKLLEISRNDYSGLKKEMDNLINDLETID